MRRICSVLLLLIAAALLSGCNLFAWTYSEEESNDPATVLAAADASFRDRDFSKAVVLYGRALALQPKNNYPRLRKLQCLLLRIDSSTPLLDRHEAIFSPPETGTAPLYGSWSNIRGLDLLTDCKEAYHLLPYIPTGSNGFWSSLGSDNSAVLNDSALASAVYGFMQLQDGNGNGIPFESSDPGRLLNDFNYDVPAGLTAVGRTNLSYLLSACTNALHTASGFLGRKSDPAAIWQNLQNNINTTISSVETAISGLGVL